MGVECFHVCQVMTAESELQAKSREASDYLERVQELEQRIQELTLGVQSKNEVLVSGCCHCIIVAELSCFCLHACLQNKAPAGGFDYVKLPKNTESIKS